MSLLEKSVVDLANALDNLETKIEHKLDDHASNGESIAAARRQAHSARTHAAEASRGLADAIADIKALLDRAGGAAKG